VATQPIHPRQGPHGGHARGGEHFWSKEATFWTVQSLLALAVLFAGAMKAFAPTDALDDTWFAPVFLRAIGICEMLGAAGLILPGLFKIQRWLTPLAAAGLLPIMLGATVTEIVLGHWGVAPTPFLLALMSAFVLWARWPWTNIDGSPFADVESEARATPA
jgi:hypothetical protein